MTNLETKIFEIRDRATFISAIGVWIDTATENNVLARYLLRRAGYGDTQPSLLLMRADGGECHYDPYQWGNRTMIAAHEHIASHWSNLASGALIDVEFVLGETAAPKQSERVTCRL